MPKTLQAANSSLIQEAGNLYQRFTEWRGELGSSANEEARSLAARLLELNETLTGLHNNDAQVISKARVLFPKLPPASTVEQLTSRTAAALQDTVNTARDSEALKAIRKLMPPIESKGKKARTSTSEESTGF